MGQVADAVFAAESPGTFDAWFGALAYTFQLYFDFSAYSEMAIGIGLMLGFECPRNFDAPYRADSFSDFWRRWHISLSSWLRDYLYIPLGGNRTGTGRTYLNLMIVFLLCGLWHGAGWTFIVWGRLAWLLARGRASPRQEAFLCSAACIGPACLRRSCWSRSAGSSSGPRRLRRLGGC